MDTKRKKGITELRGLPTAALLIGIAVIVVAILITVLGGLASSNCSTANGVEGTYINSTAVSPVTQSYIGCCTAVNGTQAGRCNTWAATAALNATQGGITGLSTFNDFWGVLVLIVILSIVIVALYAVFPKSAGY